MKHHFDTRIEVAKLLLEKEARTDIKDSEGKTALERPREMNAFGVALLLAAHEGYGPGFAELGRGIWGVVYQLSTLLKEKCTARNQAHGP